MEQSIAGCTALIDGGAVAAGNIPVVYNNRGIAYRAKGDLDRAIADYSEAIRLDPDYDTAFFNRGRAYYLKRDYDRAIADYGESLRINPPAPGRPMSTAVVDLPQRDPARADSDYSEAVKIDPSYAYAFNMRGMAYRMIGDPAGPSPIIRKRSGSRPISRSPTTTAGSPMATPTNRTGRSPTTTRRSASIRASPNALVNRGLAWARRSSSTGRSPTTPRRSSSTPPTSSRSMTAATPIAQGRPSTGRSPTIPRPSRTIQRCHRLPRPRQRLSRPSVTMPARFPNFDQAIKLDAGNAPSWNSRCWARAMTGQLEQALSDRNELLRLRTDPYTLDSRGLVPLKLGHYDAAISDYDAVLKSVPDFPDSLYGRGIAKRKKGDAAGGDADLSRAKALRIEIVTIARYGIK